MGRTHHHDLRVVEHELIAVPMAALHDRFRGGSWQVHTRVVRTSTVAQRDLEDDLQPRNGVMVTEPGR
eukprot:2494394-Amphidinium_carterae.2